MKKNHSDRLRGAVKIRLCTLIALCVFFNAQILSASMREGVDTLFVNGTAFTADEQDRTAEALAVRDGRIVFVGSAQEAEGYLTNAGEVVDLGGGLLLPGFADTHIHTLGTYWTTLFDADLNGIDTLEETIAALRECVRKKPDKEAYWAFGYPGWRFPGAELQKGPRRERLDEICPDKPMYVYSYDGHTLWLNTRALELAGIVPGTRVPQGGVVEVDDRTGELWGTLKEAAITLAPRFPYDSAAMVDALKRYQASMNALGYTSILTVAAMWDIIPIPFDELYRMDVLRELTLKVNTAAIIDTNDDVDARIAEILALKERFARARLLRAASAKFFADGVVDSHTAWLTEPYVGEPENYGTPFWSQRDLNEAFAKVNAAGLQIHIHSIGDAATRSALDAFAYARAHAPHGDPRNTITHLQIVRPDDLPRFARLGVIASTQPYWHQREAYFWEPVEYAAIGRRAETQYPLKSLADAGARLTFSSDSPVTAVPNPLIAIETGVTRNSSAAAQMDDPAHLLNPAERLSVREMIRGFTIDSAYALFRESETGSLEVGKAADLVVLDADILEIDPVRIDEAVVLRTYLDGKLVYRCF